MVIPLAFKWDEVGINDGQERKNEGEEECGELMGEVH